MAAPFLFILPLPESRYLWVCVSIKNTTNLGLPTGAIDLCQAQIIELEKNQYKSLKSPALAQPSLSRSCIGVK